MATSGLYGQSTNVGGTYFEWFIFQESLAVPATPTTGSWNFSTNVGIPPTGWTLSPTNTASNPIWVSIAYVDSRNPTTFVWSLPVVWAKSAVGTGTVTSTGVATANGFAGSVTNPSTTPNITLSTTTSGMLKGSGGALVAATAGTDYTLPSTLAASGGAALVGNTPAGNISAITVQAAINELDTEKAATGVNNDITSLTGMVVPLSVTQGGTGVGTTSAAAFALKGVNTDITSLSGKSVSALALNGANTDITSLASPALGSATAATQSSADSSTKVATTAFVNPAFSKSATGYVKLPSGVIIQWGITSALVPNSDTSISMPLTFPVACVSVTMTRATALNTNEYTGQAVTGFSTTSFTARHYSSAGISAVFSWIAFGY